VNLLPHPRFLKRHTGFFLLPVDSVLHLDSTLPRDSVLLPCAERLKTAAAAVGVKLELVTGPAAHPRLAIRAFQSESAPNHPEGYVLTVAARGVALAYREAGGLRAGIATLRQLFREYGRQLPRLSIRDHPDFPRRGVMLDISRGRVPRLETLIGLVEHLADFKINEFQLYTEHTFAYRKYEPVWREWGALTGEEILALDARCRALGIDLVPNQNSFGHLRYWLEYPPLKRLAEVRQPYPGGSGDFLRYPSTLAPENPGTLRFLRGLYDELLPHFTSKFFNVGCDETWDLGRGQSKRICARKGKGRVYLDFLRRIHCETRLRNRQMMCWGDILLHYPELIEKLPSKMIALNWGYEEGHPFDRDSGRFARASVPFYVCPGTSTWMTLIGRHDNAFANLREAAAAGRKHGAIGFLNTDWGDGGHPQPLAVSYLPFLMGAAVSWCGETFREDLLIPVLNRDVFVDSAGVIGGVALGLGMAHKKFRFTAPNVTPYGAVIAAPPRGLPELFCRDGLKYYARIPRRNIEAALEEVERQLSLLKRGRPRGVDARILATELALAARMAAQSCQIMLWQQALATRDTARARRFAKQGIKELLRLDQELKDYWPFRNKGSTAKCSPFLRWRIDEYRRKSLAFTPDQARPVVPEVPTQ
jgi:hexosaminidase